MDRLGDRRGIRIMLGCALAFIVACLAGPAVSLAKPPEAAAERVRLFEWFSALGVPDVKHPRFVRYPHSLDGRPESKLCYCEDCSKTAADDARLAKNESRAVTSSGASPLAEATGRASFAGRSPRACGSVRACEALA